MEGELEFVKEKADDHDNEGLMGWISSFLSAARATSRTLYDGRERWRIRTVL
jgi:hypothetical protein